MKSHRNLAGATSLILLSALFLIGRQADADDFTTKDGKTYAGVKVIGIAPDGITVKTVEGAVKLKFKDLPEDVQKKYGYSPGEVKEYRKDLAEDKQKVWDEWKRDRKRYWNNVKKEREERKKRQDKQD